MEMREFLMICTRESNAVKSSILAEFHVRICTLCKCSNTTTTTSATETPECGSCPHTRCSQFTGLKDMADCMTSVLSLRHDFQGIFGFEVNLVEPPT